MVNFTKGSSLVPAIQGGLASSVEYNQNLALIAKDSLIPVNQDGTPTDGDLGSETIGGTGVLIKDMKVRNTSNIKVYNASGVFQKDILINNIASIPTGHIMTIANTTIPSGYLECNGSAINRITYSALFTAIGTIYGVGDGSTTFTIPDLRGQFIRGWDHGAGNDIGRVFGTFQSWAIENIIGQIPIPVAIGSGTGALRNYNSGSGQISAGVVGSTTAGLDFNASRSVNTSTETRPRNTAMMFIIKY